MHDRHFSCASTPGFATISLGKHKQEATQELKHLCCGETLCSISINSLVSEPNLWFMTSAQTPVSVPFRLGTLGLAELRLTCDYRLPDLPLA